MGKHSKSGKFETSVVGAVIAAVCIIIYLGALVQGCVRVYLSIDQRSLMAEQEFDTITALALSDGRRRFMDERFIETMNNALAASKSIEALIISGPEGEYAFERQKGYAVNWVNNSPRFINRFSFSKKDYYRPLSINDLRNTNIKAVARAFDFFELSGILKETLLIIMIGFAISFFTMILQLLTGKPVERIDSTATSSSRAQYWPEPIVKTQDSRTSEYKAPEYKASESREATLRDYQRDKIIDDMESEPKGLYSSRSNIGWEEYIKDRLDSELHRCASTEKDLTLMFLAFTEITNDTMYKQAAEEAVAFFTSRDLLFEFGKNGICAILPGLNLESGLLKAEKFYQRFLEKFPDGGKYNSSLRIGISSRSGRLLNAERLIMEVTEALNRAKKDLKSPITAFKSDLDRYRAFIASQN